MKTLIINKENPKGIKKDITEEISTPKEFLISELKQKLADTDYIACKIAEGAATKEEYAEVLAEREAWRKEINQIQNAEV